MANQGDGGLRRIASMLTFPPAVLSVVATILVAGCHTAPAPVEPPAAAIPTVTILAADLPGKWGLASFRKDEDRARTQTEAKGSCSNPYVIKPGPTSGVMMHLADQADPSELFLKVDPQGRTFLGPAGPPAVAQDRLIESYENDVMVMQWVDPGVRERYGTMMFVRCGK